ncbi:MAG: M23 family metallopeptidase [Candidatus Latescibacteria bacterium]|jgi:murein DD-endopeptidase MepM/ murein hydrolase activator NlpD|nr:M23 family metallopeptidase [Candidatus Latescibacterota bacterium]
MDNRFFSLIVVPDSGSDVKTGSFNFKFILSLFSALFVIFFICLFFIIGYHIKLSQENKYKSAVSTHKEITKHISDSQELFNTLSEKLAKIQRNDRAFRLHERMEVIDDEMYMAGIGGHVIVNESDFSIFKEELKVKLNQLAYGLTTLDNRINVQENSLMGIQLRVQENIEEMDNTPSIAPAISIRVTSRYGYRRHPLTRRRHFHNAIDLGGYRGQPIYATADGVVISARYSTFLGNYIKIRHKKGYETVYAHLHKLLVKTGQEVKKRQEIAKMGSTGRTTGIHVHYSVLLNGRSQNPLKHFK